MAEDNFILGTGGKDSLPLEYQLQRQAGSRKRALAQALMQNGMKGARPVQMFGRHASIPGIGEHLASALQTYMGAKRMGEADAGDAELMQRVEQDQQAELSDLMAQRAQDPKAAISKALLGRFGRTRALGSEWQKTDSAQAAKIGDLLGAADPRVGAQFIQGDNPQAPLPELADRKPVEFTDSAGNMGQIVYDRTGKPTVTYAPKATTVSVDNRVSGNADEDAIKYFNYGGKGYEKGVAASQALSNTATLLDTLDKNPTMGAGAEGIQFLRKWAQTLGAPVSEATTPTEMAKMQLGQKTLDRLGGLGAQVSDADRKFMLETQGALGNDPEAVRRMLLIEAKYLMQLQSRMSGEASEVAARRPGVTLPTYGFSFTPSQRNADDLERLMSGQGFGADPRVPQLPAGTPTGAPRPAPPGRIRRVQ